MHENPEMHVSSAKQLMELHNKREKEALRKKAAENKATQLASEQVALLKEASLRSEQERNFHKSNNTDVVDIKPNFYGLGVNLNEAWRRLKQWCS